MLGQVQLQRSSRVVPLRPQLAAVRQLAAFPIKCQQQQQGEQQQQQHEGPAR